MKQASAMMIVALLSAACSSNDAGQSTTPTPASGSGSPATAAAELQIDVITSPEQAGAVNSVLLHGPTEVVIVDAQFTKSGATAVADAAEKSGKTVSRVFITHAHPDHYLGTAVLKERFPGARFIAVAPVVEDMKASAMETAKARQGLLGPEFPGMPVIPEVHDGDTLTVDGVDIQILADLKGDMHSIACLYIESQGTLIASDVGYIDVHLWTATTDHEGRLAWAQQAKDLKKLPGLTRVIPGHQLADSEQTPAVLDYTHDYIMAFDQTVAQASSPDEVLEAMSTTYPDARAALFLQIGAGAAFAEKK